MKKILKKLLKILLILIAIIGFIFGIITIIKLIKLNKIYNQANEYLVYDSFYLKTTLFTNNEFKSETQAYYRKGTGKLVASNDLYSWTDGERAYMIDESNNTAYILDLNSNFALVSYKLFASAIPGYNSSIIDRFFLAGNLSTKIKKEKIDDIMCYCIETKENLATKKIWLEKDTSKVKKATIEFSNGDVFNYEYELEFNCVKTSEIKLPDLTGYTLINSETGTILSEKFNME